MISYERGSGYDLKHLLRNFPWDSVGSGTVVDVSIFLVKDHIIEIGRL